MTTPQPGILENLPKLVRYLTFRVKPDADPRTALKALRDHGIGADSALFRFTHPVTGSYFWCPPVVDGQLDLQAVGL